MLPWGTFQEVPLLLMWNSLGDSEQWGHVLGEGRARNLGLRLHEGNRSARKRTQTLRTCKALKKCVVNARLPGLSLRAQDSWSPLQGLPRGSLSFCLSFPPLINKGNTCFLCLSKTEPSHAQTYSVKWEQWRRLLIAEIKSCLSVSLCFVIGLPSSFKKFNIPATLNLPNRYFKVC